MAPGPTESGQDATWPLPEKPRRKRGTARRPLATRPQMTGVRVEDCGLSPRVVRGLTAEPLQGLSLPPDYLQETDDPNGH